LLCVVFLIIKKTFDENGFISATQKILPYEPEVSMKKDLDVTKNGMIYFLLSHM
jgi:hypothetical protein